MTDRELLSIRRALYADARRRGDPLATANAAARLRAHIAHLNAVDLAAVRASRRTFGQAIRQARSRRVAPPPTLSSAEGIALVRPRRVPFGLVAALALLALVLVSVLARPFATEEAEGGGGGAPVAALPDAPIIVSAQSRGRVVVAEVAAVSAVVEPEPTVAPQASAEPSSAPAAGAGPAAGSAGPTGSGGPGTGTGSGSGSGAGSGTRSASPAPTATPTPAPTFAACFVSIPRGFARLCGLVVDLRTGSAIAGACVSLGPCTDQSARTDPNGRWAFVLPVGNGTLQWDLEFAAARYQTAFFTQTSRQGFITIPTQRLVAAP